MLCSNCGYELGPDDQYCGGCGAFLTDAPEEETTPGSPHDDIWGTPGAGAGAAAGGAAGAAAGAGYPRTLHHSTYPRDGYDEPQRNNTNLIGVIVGAVVGLALVGLLLTWMLGGDDNDTAADTSTTPAVTETTDGEAPTEPATETDTDTAAPEETEAETETESPTETPTPTSIDLPGSAQSCSSVGGFTVHRGNSETSCPFSENVARAYAALDPEPEDSVQLTGVTSPVTGQSYTLTCDYSTPVRCTGGNNAVIYLTPGS